MNKGVKKKIGSVYYACTWPNQPVKIITDVSLADHLRIIRRGGHIQIISSTLAISVPEDKWKIDKNKKAYVPLLYKILYIWIGKLWK